MWISRLSQFFRQRFLKFQFRRMSEGQPALLSFKNVYGLPTSEGLLFALYAFILLMASATYGNNLMFACSFWGGAMYLVLPGLSCRNLLSCRFVFQKNKPVFQGDKSFYSITVHALHPVWGLSARTDNGKDARIPRVHHATLIQIPYIARTRGNHPVPPIRVASGYPMNLFTIWGWIKSPHHTLIYPKPQGQALDSYFQFNSSTSHSHLETDLNYTQHREFQPGDSTSRIDWPRSTVLNKTLIREYRPSGDTGIYFDVENTRMPYEDIEERLSQLCLWIVQAEKFGYRYALKAQNRRIDLGRGYAHKHECLKLLATYSS